MRHDYALPLLMASALALSACTTPKESAVNSAEQDLHSRAQKLAQDFIIVDTHVDVPYRLSEKWEDISVRTAEGDFDYERAKKGGLNAPFMSIYIPAEYQDGRAKQLADKLIDMVEKFVSDWPDKFAVATSVADIRSQFKKGLISLPMGMENGAPIEGDLANLKHFYDRGIRYITLTHSKSNHISDSSYDPEHKWNGLSPFGRDVVAEMNRLGVMVDISHISDEAFYQVLELSKAPVIASHSSLRKFTPGWERNMSDDMLRLLAQKGGVIQVAFGSSFVNDEYRRSSARDQEEIKKYLEDNQLSENDEAAREYTKRYHDEHPIPHASLSDVADHIDHVVKLVGIDHVGLGSDFDGVGDSLPTGLKDVSEYPNLIEELLKRDYSEQDIEKICSGNLLRVWSEVERIAHAGE